MGEGKQTSPFFLEFIMKSVKKTCLIIEWISLPEEFKEKISDNESFHNDCILPFWSEFDVESIKLGMSAVEEYWQYQVESNEYKGNLEGFIKDYHLEFEVWLINQKLDLEGVDEILIKVCW